MKHDLEKKYYEQLALKILEFVVYIDVANLKNKEEPDWHNDKDSVGIEITIADESLRFYRELEKVDKVDTNKVKKFNKRYIRNGGRVITKQEAYCIGIECSFKFNNNYVYIIPAYDNNFENINKAIKNKTEKLNKNYKLFNQNNLFVFSHIRTRKELFQEELNEIIEIESKFEKKFNFIYICLTDCIAIFDLENKVYDVKEFNISKFEI